jgi:hypothetical protein
MGKLVLRTVAYLLICIAIQGMLIEATDWGYWTRIFFGTGYFIAILELLKYGDYNADRLS